MIEPTPQTRLSLRNPLRLAVLCLMTLVVWSAHPAPAMDTLHHGRGDPLGSDQQRRQDRGQLLRTLAQVVGTLGWAQDRRRSVR